MSKELPFLVYCIEAYRNAKGLSGKEVIQLFNEYGVLEYITRFFDVLHTFGPLYIIDDIDSYIASQRAS